ncbi:MAG: (Fe-S)-binding protein [Acidobacteriota bacterium]|nr:(Fe-S)-binding protein [Acidobacteriota bacterium]MDE3147391.1 (Fe-S)-binding protein [Acidobacteriota bacterium]
MRVALFITCVNDGLFPDTPRAVVEVLERLGHHVVFPTQQTCCGQMHLNAGYRQEGLHLAQRFRQVFHDYDVIVSPSASCVGTVRELYPTSARSLGDDALADDLEEVGRRTYEFSEFLTDVLKVTDVGASFPHRVAYHPTCHSLRVLGLDEAPKTLLRHVEGLQLVDIAQESQCCGFGGMFSIKNAETSVAMGRDKLAHVRAADVDVLCALDNSCLTHIGGLASRARTGLRMMHVAEILAARPGGAA